MTQKREIGEFLQGVRHVAIAGHVNPDGDCIGSCMGTFLYLRDNYPDIRTDVYLEPARDVFHFIADLDKAQDILPVDAGCDLLILLDISSRDRIGVAGGLLEKAEKTLCFDHHVTNPGGFTWFFNEPGASSASEVVCGFMDEDRMSADCAAAIYTGIVHDTGVFQYASTSPETMRLAARLMEKQIPFSRIIDQSYYQKSWEQNRACGQALQSSELFYGGRLIMSTLSAEEMRALHVTPADMDGIAEALRSTIGVEASAFMYETEPGLCKVSLRSKETADVSALAQTFGGGGHMRAAGCTLRCSLAEAKEKIREGFGSLLQEEQP